MATLEELREWLQGNETTNPELPKQKSSKEVLQKTEKIITGGKQSEHGEEIIDELLNAPIETYDYKDDKFSSEFPPVKIEKMSKEKIKKSRWDVKYNIAVDGSNVVFLFGKHKGKSAKGVLDIGDINYLIWLVKQPFPEELINVVLQVMRDSGKAFML